MAERTGALLATSICGHGLFAGNPWSVGISGGFASPAADELISESDLILGFGVSLTHWTTKRGKLIAPGAVVAQIDIEAGKLGYQMPVQHAVQADARIAAQAILAELDKRRNRPHARVAALPIRASESRTATTTARPIRTRRPPASSIRAR